MSNMDINQREGFERATLSDSSAHIRRGSEKGAAVYSIIAIILGGLLCYAAYEVIEGWAQWLVLGVLIVFSISLAFAVGPNRLGAGSAHTTDNL